MAWLVFWSEIVGIVWYETYWYRITVTLSYERIIVKKRIKLKNTLWNKTRTKNITLLEKG